MTLTWMVWEGRVIDIRSDYRCVDNSCVKTVVVSFLRFVL